MLAAGFETATGAGADAGFRQSIIVAPMAMPMMKTWIVLVFMGSRYHQAGGLSLPPEARCVAYFRDSRSE